MLNSLWTAASGMRGQQLNIDTISNNLSNVNTSGFKKSRVDFQDLMYQEKRRAGTPTGRGSMIPAGTEIGHGVRPVATQKIFTQGNFQETGNPLDLVIEGDGFFRIRRPDGRPAYTRAGDFKLDQQGRLVTSDGLIEDSNIYIPPDATDISVGSDGTVAAIMPGDSRPQEVGQLLLARFVNPAGLKNLGSNLYEATEASGDPLISEPGIDGIGQVGQGFLEMSNVDVVDSMVNMIIAQRAYEVNSKSIQTSDDMLQTANNLRR